MDENYVREILEQLPDGLTRAGFFDRCRPDINAGWRAEVEEAWKQYKEQGRAARR